MTMFLELLSRKNKRNHWDSALILRGATELSENEVYILAELLAWLEVYAPHGTRERTLVLTEEQTKIYNDAVGKTLDSVENYLKELQQISVNALLKDRKN